jgi:putative transposase
MARLPRYAVPGVPQHVIQRGNNRSPIFFSEDDCRFYLDCLREACAKQRCAVHAYVLMTNHVHLLMTPRTPNAISKVMQSVGRRYVQYVNANYERTGTLWEGRYRATLIDSEQYLLTCCRYIELNPVRAGVVRHPRRYTWSSYNLHAHGEPDPLIELHPMYLALDRSLGECQAAYRELCAEALDEPTIQLIRDATNKAWVLGGESFRRQIEVLAKRRTEPLPRGGLRRPTDPAPLPGEGVRPYLVGVPGVSDTTANTPYAG